MISLEIGTYQGGSLQVIARYSQRAFTVDCDPGSATAAAQFPNVEFHCGDSAVVGPNLILACNALGSLQFVLIDGGHSEETVRQDINAVLKIIPTGRIVILLHDSFNPGCRAGMRSAAWEACPFCHYVELDYIAGVYHEQAVGNAEAGSMWGGFALAVLSAERRTTPLTVSEAQRFVFEAVREKAHL